MTQYENLKKKIDLTLDASKRTDAAMREIWQEKSKELQCRLDNLTIAEAMEVVHG